MNAASATGARRAPALGGQRARRGKRTHGQTNATEPRAAAPLPPDATTAAAARAAAIDTADRRALTRTLGLAGSGVTVSASLLYIAPPDTAAALIAVGIAAAAVTAARTAYFLHRATSPVPSPAPDVRPAPGKGNGAFATIPLPRHTYLGDYTGELISNEELHLRNAQGQGDYLMVCGAGAALDGAAEAADVTRFSLAHTNHAPAGSRAANLIRVQLPNFDDLNRPRWAFFTARQVDVGEELQWTYSPSYWKAREGAVDLVQ